MIGIIYDGRLCLHQETDHLEQPDRIRFIYKTIMSNNLSYKCKIYNGRIATEEEILSIHTNELFKTMSSTVTLSKINLCKLENSYNSLYLNHDSFMCAMLAAGSVIKMSEEVIENRITSAIAIVRPPGHHAEPDKAGGFCIFNNVAAAASTALKKYNLKRIAIVDFDVHHGNGTQKIFEHDEKVLFISIHRYDNGHFYPGKSGNPKYVGIEKGIGKNVNIALNTNGNKIGNNEYKYIYKNCIKLMLKEFDPELILLSAGFDCVIGDPLGNLDVDPEFFNYLTLQLMKINPKIVVALEGGYNLTSISQAMLAIFKALAGDEPLDVIFSNSISSVAINAVNVTKNYHKKYWKFLENLNDLNNSNNK